MKKVTNVLIIIFFIFITLFLMAFLYVNIISTSNNPLFDTAKIMFLVLVLIIFYGIILKAFIEVGQDKKGINPFKKHTKKEVDILYNNINNIKGYKKIKKDDNGFILINEAGIFEIRFVFDANKVKGDISDSFWFTNKAKVPNPFIINDSTKYFVLNQAMLCKITGVKIVTKSRLIFVLENHLNNKIYSEKEINMMYEEIEVKYGHNENKIY